MTIGQMRLEVYGLSPTRTWKQKVRAMPDYQIYKIYTSRILNPKPKKKEEYHQMTLGEYFGGEFR